MAISRSWLPVVLGGALVACASRGVPRSYPADAPASRQGAPGPKAQVTRALAADPPLPGDEDAGWEGLGGTQSRTSGPAEPGHHHGHHHGGGASHDHASHAGSAPAPGGEAPHGDHAAHTGSAHGADGGTHGAPTQAPAPSAAPPHREHDAHTGHEHHAH